MITCQDNPSEPSPLGRNSRHAPFGVCLGCRTGPGGVCKRPEIERASAGGAGAASPLPEAFRLCFPCAFCPSALCCPCSCPLQAVFPPRRALQGPGPPPLRLFAGWEHQREGQGKIRELGASWRNPCQDPGTSTPSVPGLGSGLQAPAEQGAFAEGWSVHYPPCLVSHQAPNTQCHDLQLGQCGLDTLFCF